MVSLENLGSGTAKERADSWAEEPEPRVDVESEYTSLIQVDMIVGNQTQGYQLEFSMDLTILILLCCIFC